MIAFYWEVQANSIANSWRSFFFFFLWQVTGYRQLIFYFALTFMNRRFVHFACCLPIFQDGRGHLCPLKVITRSQVVLTAICTSQKKHTNVFSPQLPLDTQSQCGHPFGKTLKVTSGWCHGALDVYWKSRCVLMHSHDQGRHGSRR